MAQQQLLATSPGMSFVGLDLHYRSEDWNKGDIVPSQALIIPHVGTARGFSFLRNLLKAGIEDVEPLVRDINNVTEQALTDVQRAEAACTNIRTDAAQTREMIDKAMEAGIDNLVDRHILSNAALVRIHLLNAAAEGLSIVYTRRAAMVKFGSLAKLLAARFRVLTKIADTLDAIQTQHGEGYASDEGAVMRLTVCIKCLDSEWAKMLTQHRALQAAEKGFQRQPHYLFPFEDFEPLDVGEEEGEDDDGEE